MSWPDGSNVVFRIKWYKFPAPVAVWPFFSETAKLKLQASNSVTRYLEKEQLSGNVAGSGNEEAKKDKSAEKGSRQVSGTGKQKGQVK